MKIGTWSTVRLKDGREGIVGRCKGTHFDVTVSVKQGRPVIETHSVKDVVAVYESRNNAKNFGKWVAVKSVTCEVGGSK